MQNRHGQERKRITELYWQARRIILGDRFEDELSPKDAWKVHDAALVAVDKCSNRAMKRAGGERSYGSAGRKMAPSIKTRRR